MSLPVLAKPHDTLREGLPNAVSELTPLHPVEAMQKERREREIRSNTRDLVAQQGLAAAMCYQADSKLLSQFHRLPGIPSSFSGLETYSGRDETIRFEDWLGEPEFSPQYMSNFHATMEHKLGMQ